MDYCAVRLSWFERNYFRELLTNRAYGKQHKQDVYAADLLLRKKGKTIM